jgi:hypothetical protein
MNKKAFKLWKLSFHPSSLIPSSSDEVNDLYVVAFAECGVGPVGAAYDQVVQFDGEALGGERQALDQLLERRVLVYLASLAVDFDLQPCHSFRMDERCDASPLLRPRRWRV